MVLLNMDKWVLGCNATISSVALAPSTAVGRTLVRLGKSIEQV
jgi:hypothetical protein